MMAGTMARVIDTFTLTVEYLRRAMSIPDNRCMPRLYIGDPCGFQAAI